MRYITPLDSCHVSSPNGLALSYAAPLDRDDNRAESFFQNACDLRAALRRQLERYFGGASPTQGEIVPHDGGRATAFSCSQRTVSPLGGAGNR